MTRQRLFPLVVLVIGLLAIEGLMSSLCWIDPTAGICHW